MKQVEVYIKREPGCEDVPLPKYMSEGASGMDLCAAVESEEVLEAGEIKMIPTGIRMAIPKGYEGQVRPRSGLAAKHGITLVNAPGTIDSDYRGEVRIILGNMGRETFTITRGMRIAQLVVCEVTRAELIPNEELPDTERSEGGFGHTGLHHQ